MNFYELIKNGYVIRIEDNRQASTHGFYDPAEFWMKDGRKTVWAPEIGICECYLSKDKLNAHIKQMLAEGLDIIIKHKNDFVREYR